MNPPDFKWNIQIKKQKTRLFTGTHCEYLGTFMYKDVTVVYKKQSVPVSNMSVAGTIGITHF
jgi:hypothetical protein